MDEIIKMIGKVKPTNTHKIGQRVRLVDSLKAGMIQNVYPNRYRVKADDGSLHLPEHHKVIRFKTRIEDGLKGSNEIS